MPQVSGTVYDDAGFAADNRTVRAYRRDTGVMLSGAVTPGISKPSYVAGSATSYVISTAQSIAIPTQAGVGDLLLAWVMHRSDITPPGGWTLVKNVTCSSSTVPRHDLSLYSRIAESGDPGSSTTWAQAISGRLAVHIQTYRRSEISLVGHSWDAESNSSVASAIPFSPISASSNGLIIVSGASQILANTGAVTTVIASAGTLTTPASVSENRLLVCYRDDVANGQESSGSFTLNVIDSNNGKVRITAIVGASGGSISAGQYKLDTNGVSSEVQVLYLDDAAGTLYNDLIHRVIPG